MTDCEAVILHRGCDPNAASIGIGEVSSKRTYLAAQYARLRGRRDPKKAAVVAVGHSIPVICYHLPERGVPYEELGEDYFDRQRSGEACVKRLVRQLERLGHRVALEPLPQSA